MLLMVLVLHNGSNSNVQCVELNVFEQLQNQTGPKKLPI